MHGKKHRHAAHRNHHETMIVTIEPGVGMQWVEGLWGVDSKLGHITPKRLVDAAQGEAKRQLSPRRTERVEFVYVDDTKKGVLFSVAKQPAVANPWGSWEFAGTVFTSVPPLRFGLLLVQDPSQPKEYAISVPPDMQTVDEALLWTFNLSAGVFAPTIHT